MPAVSTPYNIHPSNPTSNNRGLSSKFVLRIQNMSIDSACIIQYYKTHGGKQYANKTQGNGEANPGKVTIPFHNKDIPKGTENNIRKQAGLK